MVPRMCTHTDVASLTCVLWLLFSIVLCLHRPEAMKGLSARLDIVIDLRCAVVMMSLSYGEHYITP